jgi:hypothetical protein
LENREAIRKVLNLEGMRREYAVGIPNPEVIAPEGYTLDATLMARPGNVDIQLDLFLDYANNVKLYPSFHEYFRKWKPPQPSDARTRTRLSSSWIPDTLRSKRM